MPSKLVGFPSRKDRPNWKHVAENAEEALFDLGATTVHSVISALGPWFVAQTLVVYLAEFLEEDEEDCLEPDVEAKLEQLKAGLEKLLEEAE